jgi:hypothetical protein
MQDASQWVRFQALSEPMELLLRATAIVHRMDCMDWHPKLGVCPVLSLRGDGYDWHNTILSVSTILSTEQACGITTVGYCYCAQNGLHGSASVCPVLSVKATDDGYDRHVDTTRICQCAQF